MCQLNFVEHNIQWRCLLSPSPCCKYLLALSPSYLKRLLSVKTSKSGIRHIPQILKNYREILLIPLAVVLQCCSSADAGWECYFICVPWNFCTAESNCDLTCAGLPWAGRWRVCVWDQHELKINMSHLEMLGMTSIHSSWLWKNFRAVILCSAPSATHTHAPCWWSL